MEGPLMRLRLCGLALVLGCAIAACGGGTGIVPPGGGTTGSGGTTQGAKTTRTTISLYVPPAAKQDQRRKPFYISSSTQSFGVAVFPYGSTTTPGPSNAQIFPVATPSPCSVPSGGGETCTLVVTAPVGNDVFYVGAFATASPSANSIPISAFVSGEITVSLSPSPGATPLSFTLNGIVYSVTVAVASPDPSNTPNTQVFVSLAATSAPLAITAYDATGSAVMSAPTGPFYSPIVINASPASEGVTLALNTTSPCGSSASGAQASIECASDLNAVTVSYDGTPHPDPSDHLYDTFTIAATAQPSPASSPATIVLASNVVTYQVQSGNYAYGGFLDTLSSGELLYVFQTEEGPYIGTFVPSTHTVNAPASLSTVEDPSSVAVAPNGTLWIIDSASTINCWSTVGAATSGGTPFSFSAPTDPSDTQISAYALTVDSQNDVWIEGYGSGSNEVAEFSAASGCPATAPSSYTWIAFLGDSGDSSPFVAPLAGGGIAWSSNIGLYEATTGSSSSVSAIVPALAGANMGGGAMVDTAGNVYGLFANDGSSADIEKFASGVASELVQMVPTTPIDQEYPYPWGGAVFGPAGAADRMAYVDTGTEELGLVDGVDTTPDDYLAALVNVDTIFATTYNDNGAPYALYESYDSGSYTIDISRVAQTKTWWVPVSTIYNSCNPPLLSIDERAVDSGPFTLSISPSANATAAPLSGSNTHDWLVVPQDGETSTFSLTITDKNGRQQIIPTMTASGDDC
jgi:hypothetical protein